MPEKIAFVAYETPFAPCGGIAAVLGRLPAAAQETSGLDTVVITPHHRHIEKISSLRLEPLGGVDLALEDQVLPVHINRYQDQAGINWYFLLPEDERFFAGRRHPYDVGETHEEIALNLKRDALVFGAAAAGVLRIIDPDAQWRLMLQDWEAATTALALAGRAAPPHRAFLTLHNSYDSGPIGEGELRAAGIDPGACSGPPGTSAATVLERALPLVVGPVFTVSSQFALDLTQDPFQTRVMASHLQEALRPRLHGIDNGLFADLAVKDQMLSWAAAGHFEALQEWKAERREEALEALERHSSSAEEPVWGDFSRFAPDHAPWFILAGRDDARQKGYDVAVRAISRFLEQGGKARFFFFAMPGDEARAGLGFLKELAQRFPQSVLTFPFIFRTGYLAVLRGASYGVMPSLYEPFGMANEFYLNGTVGIGRATGGILQQIVPLRAAACFSRAVQVRAERWHSLSARPTGLLYRERDDIPSALEDWRGINAAAYGRVRTPLDRLQERISYPLFRAMADELLLSIGDGVEIYQHHPRLYYSMLAEGIDYVQRCFSWRRAAREYLRSTAP